MSIRATLAAAILPLTGPDGFGEPLIINGSEVDGTFAPNRVSVESELLGVVAESYRLECSAAALSVVVGQGLDIGGERWLVVSNDASLPGFTDAILERFV